MINELTDKANILDIIKQYGHAPAAATLLAPEFLKVGKERAETFMTDLTKLSKDPPVRLQTPKTKVMRPTISKPTNLGWGLMKTSLAMPNNRKIGGGAGHPVKGIPSYMMSRRKGWEKIKEFINKNKHIIKEEDLNLITYNPDILQQDFENQMYPQLNYFNQTQPALQDKTYVDIKNIEKIKPEQEYESPYDFQAAIDDLKTKTDDLKTRTSELEPKSWWKENPLLTGAGILGTSLTAAHLINKKKKKK